MDSYYKLSISFSCCWPFVGKKVIICGVAQNIACIADSLSRMKWSDKFSFSFSKLILRGPRKPLASPESRRPFKSYYVCFTKAYFQQFNCVNIMLISKAFNELIYIINSDCISSPLTEPFQLYFLETQKTTSDNRKH